MRAGAAFDQPAEDHRLDSDRGVRRLYRVFPAGAAVGPRAYPGEEGMDAIHRLVRDTDAGHHQCPHGCDARTPSQRIAPLEHFPAKCEAVRRRKCDQIGNLERVPDSTKMERALTVAQSSPWNS